MKMMRHIGSVVLVLSFVSGCDRSSRPVTPAADGTTRSFDGVEISYDIRGKGDIALVFIHGWACDRSFWREQLDDFAGDYRIVSLDLAGHGRSKGNRTLWSIASLARDVQAVDEKANLNKVVLVGHSLGGPVALEAARLMPDRVVAVVGADTLHHAEIRYTQKMVDEAVAAFNADFEQVMTGFVRPMFPEDPNSALADWVVSKACSANRQAVLAILSESLNFDIKQSFSAVNVPIRCINVAPYPPVNTETEVETNRKYADFDAIIMQGVGHFPMLERPKEFNGNLRKILADLTAP
ncbi:MAG: alpha/beta fold hydrolase [Planctomycetota bacterium]